MEGADFHNLHHAYLLVGSKETAEKAVLSLFEVNGAPLKGSPDFFSFTESLLGIDDARKISHQAIRRAFTSKKVFFIAPDKLTLEAQNALLKAFEEPIANTHFFLVLRDDNVLLPTLRSRVKIVRLANEKEESVEAKKFLKASLKDRLAFVKKFVDNEKNLSTFLDELLVELRGQSSASELEKVFQARLISDDRGVLPRLILEHLAVSV